MWITRWTDRQEIKRPVFMFITNTNKIFKSNEAYLFPKNNSKLQDFTIVIGKIYECLKRRELKCKVFSNRSYQVTYRTHTNYALC